MILWIQFGKRKIEKGRMKNANPFNAICRANQQQQVSSTSTAREKPPE